MEALYAAAAVVGLAALALACWMLHVEPRRFRVRRFVLDSAQLGLPPLKILHLTDTHFYGATRAIPRFVERVAQERFDLIFMTGDIIDDASGIPDAARVAGLLHAEMGTYAVLGGHDHMLVGFGGAYRNLLSRHAQRAFSGANPAGRLVAELGRAGVHVLEDEHVVLRSADGSPFAIAGLQDAFVFEPDCEKAWAGLEPDVPVIAITHSPDALPELRARGVRLAFFGHTHGGQVRFPLLGALVTRCHLPGRLASGVFRSGSTVFVINNGLGHSRVTPYRLLCPPEVSVLTMAEGAAVHEVTPVVEAGHG